MMRNVTALLLRMRGRIARLCPLLGVALVAWPSAAIGQASMQSLARVSSVVEFTVTQNADCGNPGSSDQITVLFSSAEVSPRVPPSVFGDDILAEFSFSAGDLVNGTLTFRRRTADRSFLNARFIRVVNAGANGWCSGTLTMIVDGRPVLSRVPMFPRKGNSRNGLQDWNREQWGGKTYWEAPLASARMDRK